MDQLQLEAVKRDILGKRVSSLRRQGITPVHVYGKGVDSLTLQCETGQLLTVLATAQRTRLVNLKVKGEKESRAVVVREIQRSPLRGGLLHVDFYQVQMGEEVKVDVPVVLVGEAPALESKEHALYQELDTATVECLPANIPQSIEVDITTLTEPDQVLRVKDIVLDGSIAILNDPDVVVARIAARAMREEVVEEAVAEEVSAEEGAEAPPSPEAESREE